MTEWEVDRVFNQHYPLKDDDVDGWGTDATLRGHDWRGRDCNDRDKNIYPGRRVESSDKVSDSNCNGIFGMDSASGRPFEDLYCAGTDQRGLIIVGDSATAHFSVPPAWLTAASFTNTTMDGLLHLAENELDWPACSWSTGHWDPALCPAANSLAPMKSLYQRMFERNRCMHRDYQVMMMNR